MPPTQFAPLVSRVHSIHPANGPPIVPNANVEEAATNQVAAHNARVKGVDDSHSEPPTEDEEDESIKTPAFQERDGFPTTKPTTLPATEGRGEVSKSDHMDAEPEQSPLARHAVEQNLLRQPDADVVPDSQASANVLLPDSQIVFEARHARRSGDEITSKLDERVKYGQWARSQHRLLKTCDCGTSDWESNMVQCGSCQVWKHSESPFLLMRLKAVAELFIPAACYGHVASRFQLVCTH